MDGWIDGWLDGLIDGQTQWMDQMRPKKWMDALVTGKINCNAEFSLKLPLQMIKQVVF